MKKFVSFLILIFTVFIIGSMSACSTTSVSANGFRFSVDKNTLSKTNIEQEVYLSLEMEIKNQKQENNTVVAEKFSLMQDQKVLSYEVFFGNNIIDKMSEESLSAMDKEKINIMFKVDNEVSGQVEIYYEQEKLFNMTIK